MTPTEAVSFDYDRDPERFLANVRAGQRPGAPTDVHQAVVKRFSDLKCEKVLDLGCGEGRFVRPALQANLKVVAFDLSKAMLAALTNGSTCENRPQLALVRGDVFRLPFAAQSFDAAAALYMLYHLPDPQIALVECARVLRRGGWLAVAAPSRFNDPELAHVMPASPLPTFDAENGPDQVAEVFEVCAVERWDAPLVTLPDADSVGLYLRGRGLTSSQISRVILQTRLPLTLTKRGALIFARKR